MNFGSAPPSALALLIAASVSAQTAEFSQTLRPIEDRVSEGFGNDADIEGDLLAVGDPHFGIRSTVGPREGRVYLFRRQPGPGWQHDQVLSISDSTTVDRFGESLELENGRLVATSVPENGRGVVLHTFVRTPDDQWVRDEQSELAYPNPALFFLRGDTLVVQPAFQPVEVFDWAEGEGWSPAPAPDAGLFEIRAFEDNALWLVSNGLEDDEAFRVFDREADGSWSARPPFAPVFDPSLPSNWRSIIVAKNAAFQPRYNDGVFASGLVGASIEDGAWLIGDGSEPRFGHESRIDYTWPHGNRVPLRFATNGNLLFMNGEAWPRRHVPWRGTQGIHAFRIDPERGLVPERFLLFPNLVNHSPIPSRIHASQDELFVSADETRTVAVPGYPGSTVDVPHRVLRVLDQSQFTDPCPADLAYPADVIDLDDLTEFVYWSDNEWGKRVDTALPFGVYDAADVAAFIEDFLAGCD